LTSPLFVQCSCPCTAGVVPIGLFMPILPRQPLFAERAARCQTLRHSGGAANRSGFGRARS
jgi:hypothetical protein